MRIAVKRAFEEAFILRHIRHLDDDHEVRWPGDEIALRHLRTIEHRALEALHDIGGSANELDLRDHGRLRAEGLRIDKADIALDHLGITQAADASQADRRRHADPARQFEIGQAIIVLERRQDAPVDAIEFDQAAMPPAAFQSGKTASNNRKDWKPRAAECANPDGKARLGCFHAGP
ncbi:hypothetical protein BOSE21B_100222 [Bosea sp. 21B]|nr:hypothetical protein BOSE21B_100222 [Bosea sp. 21B]